MAHLNREDFQRCPDLPTAEGAPRQSAPSEIEQLKARLEAVEAERERACKEAFAFNLDRNKAEQQRFVLDQALREIEFVLLNRPHEDPALIVRIAQQALASLEAPALEGEPPS